MKSTKLMPLRLYLIRHGETEWSLSGRHTSRTDIPLSKKGENDACELGRRIRGIDFSRILTSPKLRARQTGEFSGFGSGATIEPDLTEWDYGDYEGMKTADILRAQPEWNLFRDGCPHGETAADISKRADRLISRLRELQGNVALFSHGHFARVFAVRWIGLKVKEAQHFALTTASVSILGYEQGRSEESAILLWNCGPNTTSDVTLDRGIRDAEIIAYNRAIERWENEGGETLSPGKSS